MSDAQGGNGLGSASALSSGFPLNSILGNQALRQGDSNAMYYPQPNSPPARAPHGAEGGGGAYPSGHLVPYLNQHGGDTGDMGSAGAPQLDAFYIQQPPGSFAVPLDVPDVNSYAHPQAGLPSGLPLRGPSNLPGWGAPSRQSPANAPHDAHDEADMLNGAHGYPPLPGSMPGAARGMGQPMYARPTDAHRQMMLEQEAAARSGRGAPMPKRRRTSPVPFGEPGADLMSRFRGAPQGVRGAQPPNARGLGGRREDGAPHDGSNLSELITGADDGAPPSGDITSWILGPDDQRNAHFAMPDAAAYYRANSMGQPGLRLDMPGMPPGHAGALDPSKGMAPLRSHAPNSDEEPLYVNAKQYQRILKRRMARARMEEKRRQTWLMQLKQREEQKNGGAPAEISEEWVSGLLALDEESKKPYLHESRHKHAMRRPRGPGGRFLTTEEIRKRDDEAAKKAQAEQAEQAESAPPAAAAAST
ncbi:HAP2 [Malassezia furfur]|nr:HAP2 [Malassezia furfur]